MLELPQELLYYILQQTLLTAPDDYEALMLSCKQIYMAGTPFLEEHVALRKSINQIGIRRHPHGHRQRTRPVNGWVKFTSPEFHFNGVFLLLIYLLDVPPATHQRLLSYVTRTTWSGGCWGYRKEPLSVTLISVLDRIKSEAPWLFQTVEHIIETLTHMNINVNKDMDQVWHDYNDDHNKLYCPYPRFFPGVTGLLLLPNLKRLFIKHMRYLPEIPAIVEHDRGQLYFQRLEVLHLKDFGVTSNTLLHVRPYLLLPKLKSLIMHSLRKYVHSQERSPVVSLAWPYGDKTSNVEHVTFFNADVDCCCLADMLSHLTRLRTFVWENNPQFWDWNHWWRFRDQNNPTHLPPWVDNYWLDESNHGHRPPSTDEQPDDNDAAVTMNSQEIDEDEDNPKEDPHPLADYNSDDDFDQENHDGPGLMDELGWRPHDLAPYWNPAQVLNQVLAPYKNTLENLGLTIRSSNNPSSLIEKSCLISHFRDFSSLRNLEFDTRILRTRLRNLEFDTGTRILRKRKGNHNEIPLAGIPPSLAKLLPASIEVVRMVAYHSEFQILHAMLRSLPSQKARFPHLRTITIVLNGGKNMVFLPTIVQSVTRLKPLRDELKGQGIELNFEKSQFCPGHSPHPKIGGEYYCSDGYTPYRNG
jgi:hypothetical protein